MESPRSSDDVQLDKETLELLASESSQLSFYPTKKSWLRRLSPNIILIVNVSLFILSTTILFTTLAVLKYNTHASCPQEVAWSPVQDSVPVRTTKFNETFGFPSSHPSLFQKSSMEDADREWSRFTMHPMLDGTSGRLGVPLSAITKIPKAKEPTWLASAVKLADDRYMVNLEIFHNAHCLNMLRKMIYPEYYKPYGRNERGHLEHCVETIRQALMCNSGTGLVTFHWVEGMEEPYPDYNTWHQCRDPEAVLEWAVGNAVNVPDDGTKRRGGEVALSVHPE